MFLTSMVIYEHNSNCSGVCDTALFYYTWATKWGSAPTGSTCLKTIMIGNQSDTFVFNTVFLVISALIFLAL